MKKTLLAVAALCALTSGAALAQSESPWMVRVRAVHLDSANKDSTGLGLAINNKTIPEVDISYFFSPNFAAELVLTVPQKHDVNSSVAGYLGTLKHLPPSLLAQYHFTQFQGFKPYVGAGVNYTRFSSVKLLGGAADVKRNSWGGALQVGVDIPLNKQWSLNVDVKKLYIGTDVSVGGVNAGSFKVDPVLVGVGLGYRF
ncbi:outer membrane beta-barrel protein [Acidovorax sp. Be4]|uniref:Outer membrane beta-barrel protein n=1 Tax=Acidovorax bellezanensis TaxID=2976702 RepID=A0ABT2PFD8_9BURK|nr:OmpW family outer membrane protein [Acidovorax sp. Be4]MCT9809046.1 outer membrane beta-barrel protein [Acidovorax sp. Be4]